MKQNYLVKWYVICRFIMQKVESVQNERSANILQILLKKRITNKIFNIHDKLFKGRCNNLPWIPLVAK